MLPPYPYDSLIPVEERLAFARTLFGSLQQRHESGEISSSEIMDLMQPCILSLSQMIRRHVEHASPELRPKWRALLGELELFALALRETA